MYTFYYVFFIIFYYIYLEILRFKICIENYEKVNGKKKRNEKGISHTFPYQMWEKCGETKREVEVI